MVLPALESVGRLLTTFAGSTGVGRDIPNLMRILAALPEPTASAAFTRTCGRWWTGAARSSPCWTAAT